MQDPGGHREGRFGRSSRRNPWPARARGFVDSADRSRYALGPNKGRLSALDVVRDSSTFWLDRILDHPVSRDAASALPKLWAADGLGCAVVSTVPSACRAERGGEPSARRRPHAHRHGNTNRRARFSLAQERDDVQQVRRLGAAELRLLHSLFGAEPEAGLSGLPHAEHGPPRWPPRLRVRSDRVSRRGFILYPARAGVRFAGVPIHQGNDRGDGHLPGGGHSVVCSGRMVGVRRVLY